MPSNEGHIHWTRVADDTVNFLGQELEMTSEVSNVVSAKSDPIGTIRIRLLGAQVTGLALPTQGWQVIPGTSPVLEARQEAYYMENFIRVRQA